MHVAHSHGQDSFLKALRGLLDTFGQLDDRAMLATSGCFGWNVGDVLTHVHLGLQEMLLALGLYTDDAPDADAASYWQAFPPSNGVIGDDQLDDIQFVRRTNAAYRRPADVLRHFTITANGLLDRVPTLPEVAMPFQGRVITSGDFLAIWVVELVIHHLDLQAEATLPDPDADALNVTRRVIEALVGDELPSGVPDRTVVLVGAGRETPHETHNRAFEKLAARLPVLG
ncbi:MAG TPA: maleylpyruvate isomerase N-terminal domain-containing protein [Pseudonocardiaceae bacterium]|nr:maleylpyruvate isomerase N-terminal domain-containing protein [Pseudonocardiaceae bacterium]